MKWINIFVLTLEEEYQHLLSPFCCESLSDVWGEEKKEGERKEEVEKTRGRKRKKTDEDRWTKKTSAERRMGRGS